jgi:pimeloyl-ACP methyl ester carboxylesterase
MGRLGYDKYYVQGGDWGGIIAACMGQLDSAVAPAPGPGRILGLHLNFITPADPLMPLYYAAASVLPPSWVFSPDDVGRAGLPASALALRLLDISGYMHEQATRPETLAAALVDSPVGLAAWIVEKFAGWSDMTGHDGNVTSKFPIDWLVSNVQLYWATGAAASSLRLYRESLDSPRFTAAMHAAVDTTTAVADFPFEMLRVPEVFARHRFRDLVSYTRMPRGGHFAALEEPALLAADVRKFVAGMEAAHGEASAGEAARRAALAASKVERAPKQGKGSGRAEGAKPQAAEATSWPGRSKPADRK